ncbi:MAG: hypothetical protein U0836_20085 [Pirellulales bacterium]
MISPERVYLTVALLALLALSLTAIGCAWSIPSWRRRLARRHDNAQANQLTGWPSRVGSGLVSVALACTAVVAWWGFYVVLTAAS